MANGKLSEFIDNQFGIWLGSNIDEQYCFEYQRVYNQTILPNDVLVTIKDGVIEYIKYPTN